MARATGPAGATADPDGGRAPRPLLSPRPPALVLVLLTVLVYVLGLVTGTDARLVSVLTFPPAFTAGAGTVQQTTVAAA